MPSTGRKPGAHPYHYFVWKSTSKKSGNDVHSFGAEEAVLYSLAHANLCVPCLPTLSPRHEGVPRAYSDEKGCES